MFYYTDNFQTQTDNTKSVIVNHSILDLSELFELFRVSLQIPYTTMTNFPAFRDVMEELNWLQEDEIRIYHDSLPSLDEESLACYLDYLNLIDVEWKRHMKTSKCCTSHVTLSTLQGCGIDVLL